MADKSLFREVDEGIYLAKRLTLTPVRGEPVVSWTIETADSRILKPLRTFGSKAELDMVLAVEGRKIGRLNSSVAYPVDPPENSNRPGGTLQCDWFNIEEAEP